MSQSGLRKRVLIMAGGTGGHVFPGLSAAAALREQGFTVAWLGTPQGIEARLVPANGIELHTLDIAGVRGQGVRRLLAAPVKLARAIFMAWRFLRQWRPDFVLGMGGFVAGPGGVAAWLSRTPLFIHEQNAIPGFTNRQLARFSRHVFQAFPGAFSGADVSTVGNPVRRSICELPDPEQRMQDREGAVRVLVLGGSQGAVALNEKLPGLLQGLAREVPLDIRHQAGGKNLAAAQQAYASVGLDADIEPFIDDMSEAYGWADLVICRAGALTVSELAAAGVASVLVPFPFAVDDHQTHNAQFLVQQGAALLIPQASLTDATVQERVLPLIKQRDALLAMAKAARQSAQPEATALLINHCLKEVQHG